MQEVIIDKERADWERVTMSTEELSKSSFVGLQTDSERRMLVGTPGSRFGFLRGVEDLCACSDSRCECIEKEVSCPRNKFFIFPTWDELYRWMLEDM